MPKNKGKGGKNRRRGKNQNEPDKRELQLKGEGEEYAQVVRMLGNGRCECFCFDGQSRLGHIRGKMRKKVWVNQGDIVLISLRDFQDSKCDIVMKYNSDEARTLKSRGEIPESAKINEGTTFGDEDNADIIFDEVEEEEQVEQVRDDDWHLEMSSSSEEEEEEEVDDIDKI